MADEEHLKLITQGVEVWNQWREENPDIRPNLSRLRFRGVDFSWMNLSEANLRGADLSQLNIAWADLTRANLDEAILYQANLNEVDLRGASLKGTDLTEANLDLADFTEVDLSQADLERAYLLGADFTEAYLGEANLEGANVQNTDFSEAYLIEANLSWADFSGANLSNAKLCGANLIGTNFVGANLTGADFGGANLSGANFVKARFSGANLSRAVIEDTIFSDVDLRNVNGLETVKHQGPSSIGVDAFYRSANKIPAVFLQKAGVPNDLINYVRKIKTPAIPYTRKQVNEWLENLQKRLTIVLRNIAMLEEKKALVGPIDVSLQVLNELTEYEAERKRLEVEIIRSESFA